MTEPVYDYIGSIGELIDKLSIENIKCYHANTSILTERGRNNPDAQIIADLEWIARTSGEQRVRLRDEINKRLMEALRRGGIGAAKDARTYSLGGGR